MITHEKATNNLQSLDDVLKPNRQCISCYVEYVELLEYIKQQEKKDKLLELYKETSRIRLNLFLETNLSLCQDLMEEDIRIDNIIKALEEELK